MRAAAIKSAIPLGSAVETVLPMVVLPQAGKGEWQKNDYRRDDKRDDNIFYQKARFDYHMQESHLQHLSRHYASVLENGKRHLDVCSSFDCHFGDTYKPATCTGIGINEEELSKNTALTNYVVQDFNVNQEFPFPDGSFDAATHVASIEYIVNPLDHLVQVRRVLVPSSPVLISFTTRAFWTKATRIWKQLDHAQRVVLVASYLSHAGFTNIVAKDITPQGVDEPVAVVCGNA
eukprot:TRINITY_DN1109_c10_g1_i1.p1 TRINITY_DN1109_c10_g1~~TRINITY_DN1109_c10_g1_i1.p1  ORF type:complete len:250 (+),score=26.71 TRINITY_DN1109_c10_g1_i1:53-751(+)